MSKQVNHLNRNTKILSGTRTGTPILCLAIYVSFYLVFFLTYFAQRIHPGRLTNLGIETVTAVMEAGFFLAAGIHVAQAWKTAGRDKGRGRRGEYFTRLMLRAAFHSLLAYVLIGIPVDVLVRGHHFFVAVKNILAIISLPKLAAPFLSLTMVYLLAALAWPRWRSLRESSLTVALLSLAGLAFFFLPEGILGYGLLGVFFGGDSIGCIPIATHLAIFFLGARCGGRDSYSVFDLVNLAVLTFFGFMAGVFYILGSREGIFMMAGFVAAFAIMWILKLLTPLLELLYHGAESLAGLARTRVVYVWTGDNDTASAFHRTSVYLLGYLLLFGLMALLVFMPFVEAGRSLVWVGDALNQYVPKLHRFLRYVPGVFHDIFQGNLDFQQYDFTSGMGSQVAISYDPVYWLYLLLPKGNIDLTYTIMTLVRFFLAGLSMMAMALYFKKSYLASLLAGICYAFSGFMLYAGIRHFQFITPLILLPLMVMAMEQLIRHGKWYMMTVLVALSLLCSYYFLYMNTIALGFYFVCRVLCTKEYRKLKFFFARGFTIVGSYVLGAMIGGLSLFTSFGSYLTSGRTGEKAANSMITKSMLFYRMEWIMDLFISSCTYIFSPGNWLKIGTIPLAVYGVVLFFTRDKKKEKKFFFILLTLFAIFPVCAYIFGGFSNINNRWSYIYTAFLCFAIAECFDAMDRLSLLETRIMTGLAVYYSLLVVFAEKFHSPSVCGSCAFVALTLALMLLANTGRVDIRKGTLQALVLLVSLVTVLYNSNVYLLQTSDKTGETLVEQYTRYNSDKYLGATSLRYLDQLPDYDGEDGFFRSVNLKTKMTTRCSSLVYGYKDIATFSSTLTGSIVDYNRMMGNCDWTMVSLFDYNSRTIMNELAAVKYMGVSSSNCREMIPYGYEKVFDTQTGDKSWPIYENQYALPVGYTYPTITPASSLDGLCAAQKQEASLLTAIVDDQDLAADSNLTRIDDLPLTVEKLACSKVDYDGIDIKDSILTIQKPNASATFYYDMPEGSEVYMSFKGGIYETNDGKEHVKSMILEYGDQTYTTAFRSDTYNTGQEECVMNLGYYQDGGQGSFTIRFGKEGILRCEGIDVYAQPMASYPDRVAVLGENVLEDVKVSNNTLEGNVDLPSDKMLVIALPYQSGWTAWIDGKRVNIQKVNYQYMGLNVQAGRHSIRLHYQIPGLRIAFSFMALGILLFAAIIAFNHFRRKKTYRH